MFDILHSHRPQSQLNLLSCRSLLLFSTRRVLFSSPFHLKKKNNNNNSSSNKKLDQSKDPFQRQPRVTALRVAKCLDWQGLPGWLRCLGCLGCLGCLVSSWLVYFLSPLFLSLRSSSF